MVLASSEGGVRRSTLLINTMLMSKAAGMMVMGYNSYDKKVPYSE